MSCFSLTSTLLKLLDLTSPSWSSADDITLDFTPIKNIHFFQLSTTISLFLPFYYGEQRVLSSIWINISVWAPNIIFSPFSESFFLFLFFSPHTLLLPSYQHFNILYISILKKKHLSEFHIFLQLLTHFSHIYRKTSWVFYNQSLYFFTSHLLLTYCGLVSYLTLYRSYSHWNKKIKNGLPVTKCSRLLYFYSS